MKQKTKCAKCDRRVISVKSRMVKGKQEWLCENCWRKDENTNSI